MRRGDLAELRWGDWHQATHSLSIARSRQVVAGRSVEVPVKTRTSRRCIDIDPERMLRSWRSRLRRDGHPTGPNDPIFTNEFGAGVNPESRIRVPRMTGRPWTTSESIVMRSNNAMTTGYLRTESRSLDRTRTQGSPSS